MNIITVLELIKSIGLILLGIGLILFAVGKIIERRNDNSKNKL